MTDNQFSPPLLKLIDLNAYDVFMGMILAFFLCAVLSRMLRISSTYAERDKNLSKTMIFLGAIVSLIMAVIGNSLARAFGAIGALSLIRFRTAVKSTNDLAYLFMSISIGMACGSGYFSIATGATGLFCIFILIVEKFFSDGFSTRVSLLKVKYPYQQELKKQIHEKIAGFGISFRLLSEESSNGGKSAEMLVEVTVTENLQASELVNALCGLSSELKASILID